MYTRGLSEYDRMNPNQWMETMFASTANELMTLNPKAYPDRATTYAYLQNNFVSGNLQGQNIYNLPGNELFNADGRLQGTVLPGYTDLDWWDAIHRTGMRQDYNLNIAAASEKYNLFASIGYLNEKGYLLKTDFERFNARFNVNFQPTTYLKAGVNMSASYQTQETRSLLSSTLLSSPTTSMTRTATSCLTKTATRCGTCADVTITATRLSSFARTSPNTIQT